MTWRARAWSPRLVLVAGWLAFVVYAYPGVMTMDSFDQLREGRAWWFTDPHPPAMAALWGVVDRVLPGPFGMLILQSAAFLAGVYLILRRAIASTRRAAALACAVLLFPPVLAPMAVIWKDCIMAGLLVLGAAAIVEPSRRVRVAGLVALSLATAMRYNAFAATLPLVVLLFEWRPAQRWLVRYAVATAAWLATTLVALAINAALVDREMHVWHSTLAVMDICGTLAHVDRDLPDAELRVELAPTGILVDHDLHAAIRKRASSYDFQPLVYGDGRLWDLPYSGTTPAPVAQRDAIAHAWWHFVTTYPGAYLRHRLATFAEVLGTTRHLGGIVVPHRAQYQGMLRYLGIDSASSDLQLAAEDAVLWLARHVKFLFRPHFYALLALCLVVACWRQRDALALVASGLAMELSLLPLAATPDYRYSHWLVVCVVVATIMTIARRAAGATPPTAPGTAGTPAASPRGERAPPDRG